MKLNQNRDNNKDDDIDEEEAIEQQSNIPLKIALEVVEINRTCLKIYVMFNLRI